MAKSIKAAATKKTGNRRMKRTVRRTIGALCMISAITVAAIPVPETQAYDPNNAASQVQPYSSLGISTAAEGDNLTIAKAKTLDTNIGSLSNSGRTYFLDESSGLPLLDWQFEYVSDGDSSTDVILDNAFITGYNNSDSNERALDLSSGWLFADYVTIEIGSFNNINDDSVSFGSCTSYPTAEYGTNAKYISVPVKMGGSTPENVNVEKLGIKYTLDGDPANWASSNEVYKFFDTYFPDDLNEYVRKYNEYKDAVARGESPVVPSTVTRKKSESSLYDENDDIYRYICRQIFGENEVNYVNWVNSPQRASLPDPSSGLYLDDIGRCNYDSNGNRLQSDTVFILRSDKLPVENIFTPSKSYGNKSFFVDSQGILVRQAIKVKGIGPGAFRDVTNVNKLTLGSKVIFICDQAFKNTNVLKEVIFGGNTTVGNQAFYNCKDLASVILTGVKSIGKEAFVLTSIASLTIPNTLVTIEDGAFYNCGYLQDVTFEDGQNATTIGKAAFCDDKVLSSVDFSDRNITKIGDYAFAKIQYKDNPDRMTEFHFPNYIVKGEDLGEFVLANRKGLQRVVLSSALVSNNTYNASTGTGDPDIPDTMVAGCTNLNSFEFPFGVGVDSYDNIKGVSFDPTMFYDVTNSDFYVMGPEGSPYSMPRRCTWLASMDVARNTPNGLPVTYKYYKNDDVNNPETYEISDGNLIQGIDATGKLVNCTYVPGISDANKAVPLEIPSSVAGITLNSIDSNCFGNLDSELRAKITGIKIADGNNINSIDKDAFKNFDAITYVDLGDGVKTIGETAFNDCANLKKVTLGENIESIGVGAFSACPKLVEVHFDTPGNLETLGLEDIGENAFSTGSKQLTFYGEIGPLYGPFKWAMQKNNYVDAGEGVRVCYKTNSPSNLTVILDNTNGLATLVDYPHLDQLNDYAIAAGLNIKQDGSVDNTYDLVDKIKQNQVALSNKEQNLYNAVKYIEIPEGIESIDVKGYIKSPAPAGGLDNRKNVEVYLNPATAKNANDVLEGIDYFPIYERFGLFNGLYGTTDKSYTYDDPDVYYLDKLGTTGITAGGSQSLKFEGDEKNPYGNDIIETVTMHDVKYLPDLAFYNCENLYNLSLGDDIEDVGELPIADCTKLNSIACGNSDFVATNGILYENKATGKKIIECFPGRGDVVGDKSINKNTDPELTNVDEIAEGAFSNCDTINFVNLDGISEDTIPKYCFYDCDNLSKVTIPDVVGEIEDDAFGEDPGIWLSVANPNLLLSTDAFGNDLAAKDVPTISVAEDSLVAKMSKKLGKNKVSAIIDNDPTFFVFYYCGRDGAQFGPPDKKKPGESPNGRDNGYRVNKHEVLNEYVDAHVNYKFAYWMNRRTGELYSNDDLQFLVLTKEMMTDGDKIEFEARYDTIDSLTTPGVTGGVVDPTQAAATQAAAGTPQATGSGGSGSSATKYPLTVVYGSGSGSYPEGTKVVIEAIDAPSGKVFDKWVVTGAAASVYSSTSKATTVTTAAGETIITATYKDEKSGSGNGGSGSGGATGTKTSTGTHNRTGADGTPAAGTGSSTRVDITKPGISDVDKAYASVSGSTDSFVVKITESADAANQVATALANKYGDMTPIKYFAMDISLYDATGTNKITDTTGLKVNVTMPIPDALRQYAGNNKVGAVVNGTQLEDLACKFTTVDGIPCISFTATHFSPYTIYVDTNNLQVGLMDSSPKTGDPIHPKWFVTIALAATSLFLFLKRDKVAIPVKA
ncbi:MAG: leucine-rich repeat protein [Lachnospiraceae bacterium]|nr:leucine-rich repeat protein [Lachnospiraceae bacterium]